MEKTDRQIYEEFAAQLCEWGNNGKIPVMGNQDIGYGLELQRKRLEKYHAKIVYRLKPREEWQKQFNTYNFSDRYYTNEMVWKAYRKEVDYYLADDRRLNVKDDELLYTMITWLNASAAQEAAAQESYCCPNCGAISDVGALLEGCPYCHTKFLMSELFPKVTNFYFLRDYGLGQDEGNRRIAKWMIGGGAIGFLIRMPGLLVNLFHGESLFFSLLSVSLTVGVAAVFGYFALSLSLFGRVLKDAFKQAPRAAGQIAARKKLAGFMQQFDPDFTYEYFWGKVQALVKILIFSDDRSKLAVYEGDPADCNLDNIVDSQFEGAIGLNGCRVEGDYCYLDLSVYMTDVYCQGDKLYRKSDMFRIGLCRTIRRPPDYGFSIKKVNCKSCGASFDASKERFCSYCRSEYQLKDDDWVITYMRK